MPAPRTTSAALLDSVGVNTHMSYFDKGYGNAALVAQQIKSLGVKHIRDGLHFADNQDALSVLCENLSLLDALGVKMDAVVDPRENLGPINAGLLQQFFYDYSQMIESFEGWNEPDVGTPVGWPQSAWSWQETLYASAQLRQAFGRIPVIAPALALAADHAGDLGDISQWCDFGNLHPYPAGQMPEPVITQQLPFANVMAPNRPVMITETGYFTGPQGAPEANGQPSVSELAQAKYMLRLLLAHLTAGVPRTYLYELQDENPGGGWGLVRSDGTEKLAFSAIRNLMSLLSPEPCLISTLVFTLSGPLVESLLIQNRDNEWTLFLWQGVSVWDGQKDVVNPTQVMSINVPNAVQIKIYRPLAQANPVMVWESSIAGTIAVSDHPVAVVITK